jgi:stearoyl-CoA desaturase (delta-9 desaturase)
VRMFLCYHFTNGIDSVTHVFGERPLSSGDYSTNNVLWALPTIGEGWHNNHHAFPSSAIFGFERWQLDPGAWLLRGLERLGLVWDIQRPSAEMIAAKRRAAAAPAE